MQLGKEEARGFLCDLKKIFDIVRLVDVTLTTQYVVDDQGAYAKEPYHCYAVWSRDQRCENCISAKALAARGRETKFEFINQKVYFIVAQYVELEGQRFVLEMVLELDDETLFTAYGHNKFVSVIQEYNAKLYVDALTGAYNRLYYKEQVSGLSNIEAISMLDIDDFKLVNDQYGHPVGDLVLQAVVKAMRSSVRKTDAIIRMGGDEFVLIFHAIPAEQLRCRLEAIKEAVSRIIVEGQPDLRVSVSIGAVHSARELPDLLERADQMLYIAKTEKNHIHVDTVL